MGLKYNELSVETYRLFRIKEFKKKFLPFWKKGQSQGKYPVDEIFDHHLGIGLENMFHMSINTLLDYCNGFDESDVPYLKTYLQTLDKITDKLEEIVQQTGLTREQVYENEKYREQAYKQVLTTKEDAISFEKSRHGLFMRPKRRELDKKFPIKRNLPKEICDLFNAFWDAAFDFYMQRVEESYA